MATSYIVTTFVQTTASNDDAFDLSGTGDTLFVSATGSLVALSSGSDGINSSASGQSIILDGLAYSAFDEGVAMSAPGTSLLVNGTAQSNTASGIYVSWNSYSDNIIVNGSAYSGNGAGVDVLGSLSTVHVNGLVQGVYGVWASNAGQGNNDIEVGAQGQGEIDGVASSSQNPGNSPVAGTGVVADSNNGTTISNDGHISGTFYAIASYNEATTEITNDGTISTESTTTAILLDDNNTNVGIDDIYNAGSISGTDYSVTVENGTDVYIANSGTILGSVGVVDTSEIDIDNSGSIQGVLYLDSSGDNALTNSGKIHGEIYFGTGEDTLTNSGTTTGNVVFTGTDDTFTNSGTITGAVTVGHDDTVTNDGTLYGNLSFGTGVVFHNTGSIHGGITANEYNVLNMSPGSITGTVTAALDDTIRFKGAYGHVEISNFTATGTGHDTIDFQTDDFTSYTELQSHMTQASGDVLITLDPADVVTLLNTALSHLTSADFAFT
jgi:hypothetical protein